MEEDGCNASWDSVHYLQKNTRGLMDGTHFEIEMKLRSDSIRASPCFVSLATVENSSERGSEI